MSCENAVRRLSEYRRILCKLKALGFTKVFSDHLAGAIDVSPALVRKDFADFGLTGNRKSGYSVGELIDKLNRILLKEHTEEVIMVGCGGIGRALMNYNGFAGEGIRITAGFDSNPDLQNCDAAIPVLDISRLEVYINSHRIRTAIMTVPETYAGTMADRLAAAGIRAILNFSPITLKNLPGCFIRNVNFLYELENVIYFSAQDTPE
ncbi:MAG: redox-sensing transcriptional repressor Rex [Victivallales bacterium]|nr:redox-sensing transcriptional repressor Rex [Victivallales bacterium]